MADEEVTVVETPAETVETPVETTPETSTETVVETPATPVDPEAITEQATQRAEERVLKRIGEALGLTKQEEQQAKDEGLVPPWEKEGRNPKSYKEVAEFSADLAEWKRQQGMKADEEAKAQAVEEEKQKTEAWNRHWDEQLEDLTTSGKLPKVENKDDPQDPGIVARKALWQAMYDINQTRLKENKQALSSLKEVYYEHYKDPNAQLPGADAPVSMGRSGGGSGNTPSYTHDDIRNSSFEQILSGK